MEPIKLSLHSVAAWLALIASVALPRVPGGAAVVVLSEPGAFHTAIVNSVVEDFEAASPKDVPIPFYSAHGITYTGHAGVPFPNVYLLLPGSSNTGVPSTTSTILTTNGDEDITVDFSAPTLAVGFDTYLNADGPASVMVYGASGLLSTIQHSHNPKEVGFLGLVASEPITSIRWTTSRGSVINTGFDNVRLGTPDLARALRIAGGLMQATNADNVVFDVDQSGAGNAISLQDVVLLARRAPR